MDRRSFLKSAVAGSLTAGFASAAAAAQLHFPQPVDLSLFQNINRVKDPAKKTALERSHAPVITAPATVKDGETFMVEVSVGEKLHDMGPAHWIQDIELSIGNMPAARVDLQPAGHVVPKAVFCLKLNRSLAPDGVVTLVASEHCNLHGYWRSTLDVRVV